MCSPRCVPEVPAEDLNPWFFEGDEPANLAWSAVWRQTVDKFAKLPALMSAKASVTYAQLADQAEVMGRSMPAGASIVAVDAKAPDFLAACIASWCAGRTVLPFLHEHLSADARLADRVGLLAGAFYEEGRFTLARSAVPVTVPPEWHSVFFTSGSTGAPRAVVRGWRQALYEAGHYARVLSLAPGARCRMLISPVFGASTKHLLGCLLSGCSQLSGASDVWQSDVLYGTPGQVADYARTSRERFRWISTTGEACSPAAWEAAGRLCVTGGRCLNALGGTEFGVAANSVAFAHANMSVFRGEALPGKLLEVVDGSGEVAAEGEAGLLRVTSAYLAEGYLDPCDGKPVLKALPACGGSGLRSFMTGDVASLENGRLRAIGRAGHMLKRGARWIDVSPLREALSAVPGVRSVVIDTAGSARGELRAWLELAIFDDKSFSRVIRAAELAHLPPSLGETALYAVPSLPRNRHGKVDLASLQILGNPGTSRNVMVHRPLSRAEQLATAIWNDGTPQARLEPESLDSLGIAELCTALGRLGGGEVSPAAVVVGVTFGDLRRAACAWRSSGCHVVGRGEAGTLLWFGGGVASATRAVGDDFRIVHWDLDRFRVGAEISSRSSLRDVASDCLAMWVERSPLPALWIGGFSFGALVAYESACLLAGQGNTVTGCVLLDPPDIRARAIAKLRWSAIRSFLMLRLLSPVARLFPYRVGRETRNALKSGRRALMRHYNPSPSSFPVRLFVCASSHQSSRVLFSPAAAQLAVSEVPVQDHMQVVRNHAAVRVWTECLHALRPSADSIRFGATGHIGPTGAGGLGDLR